MVILWHMQLQTTQVWDGTVVPDLSVHTEISPLSVEFDIDHQLMSDPPSIQVNYSYSSKETDSQGNLFATAVPVGSSTPPSYWRTNPARNIETCDPSLNVTDPGAQDIPNSFSLGVFLQVPITLTIYPPGQQPQSKPLGTTLGVDFFFAYDFTQTNQSDTLQPPGQPWGINKTEVIAPTGFSSVSASTYTVTYTLTTKQLALNYTPTNQDMRSSTEGGWSGYSPITSNLAQSGSQWFLHANNQVQPTVDGADVSSDFIIYRWVRSWLAPVGTDGNRSDGYAGAAAPGAAIPSWIDDNMPDDTGQRRPSWADVPGGPSLPSDPNKWPTVRQLDEFIASVNGYPEFGFIYYLVVWDVMPNAYRIRMYPSQTITADQVCQIKNLSAPYMDEGTWQPPIADLNNTSEMIDTGWVDSSGSPVSPGP